MPPKSKKQCRCPKKAVPEVPVGTEIVIPGELTPTFAWLADVAQRQLPTQHAALWSLLTYMFPATREGTWRFTNAIHPTPPWYYFKVTKTAAE